MGESLQSVRGAPSLLPDALPAMGQDLGILERSVKGRLTEEEEGVGVFFSGSQRQNEAWGSRELLKKEIGTVTRDNDLRVFISF